MEQFGNLETMSVEEAVGSLKAHEERLKGKQETSESQLLLTEEEWIKREANDRKLLLTREEWLKRTNNEGSSKFRGKGGLDKSKVRCFNCQLYGHFAAECKRPKKTREQKQEVNMALVEDDEPALLLAKFDREKSALMLLDEQRIVPSLVSNKLGKGSESNVWYLDNGASNHMTGFKTKFIELDESITDEVRFGDGSAVKIEGKGTVMMACKNGEEKTLNEVFYIPNLRNNIISLG